MISVHEWLFMIFRSELVLAFQTPPADGRFWLEGVEYRTPDDNYLTAFYDRLIGTADRLIGIRIHPATEIADALLGRVRATPYLHLGPGYIDVFLTGTAVPDSDTTSDQAFGGQIFTSRAGDLAVSVDLGNLCTSRADLEAIRGADAKWMPLDT